ncbi:beta-N-acetylhexosaminidase [Paenibacillus lemnae]
MFCLIIVFVLGSFGCGQSQSDEGADQHLPAETSLEQDLKPEPEPEAVPEQAPPEDPVVQQMKTLSVAEKIGQLVIIGIEGSQMDDTARRLLETYHVGGFIFFKDNIQNPSQAVRLFNEIKEANAQQPIPLWMSIDEEGGRVTRLPDELSKLPASGKIGKENNSDLAAAVGKQIGKRLAAFGLNLVYAPVLDVNSNPGNPVIGDRAFSDQAEVVTQLGIAQMKGIQESGVVPVIKHFPGHGDTSVDSHTGLPIVNHGLERLNQLELLPFREAVTEGANVVMVSHLLITEVDSSTPASFSKPVITGLLREKLGFRGVVITDDMTMGAITGGEYDIGEAAVQSILAGSNIVMVGHDYVLEETVIQSLTNAVQEGRISEEVLNDRVQTVLSLKHKHNVSDNKVEIPDIESLNNETLQILNNK